MELDKIYIKNEYDPLKTVIVGISPHLYFPNTHEIEGENSIVLYKKILSLWIYPLFKGMKVASFINDNYQKELESLVSVLSRYGVKVIRPETVYPLPNEPLGLGQMFARDPILCIQDNICIGQLHIPMRQKEKRGFSHIIKLLEKYGQHIVSINTDTETYLEGGDVLVDLPYVYVGIGKYASNLKGATWLQKILGYHIKVIPIFIQDPSILHLDCCMTIIGEKRGIICPEVLQNPLPEPLKNYQFIEVDRQTQKELGTNVLVINPQTIIIQKRHQKLKEDLEHWGFTVISLDYTWHAMLDGAFRCTTTPLYRGD